MADFALSMPPTGTAASRDQGIDFNMIRILLAEDDDVMREYLARALTSAGDKDGQPQWSPKGDQIAFIARRDKRTSV